MEIITEGAKKSKRDEYWMLYCSMYPHMTEDSFESFDSWYDRINAPKISVKKSKDEIMSDVERILRMGI